eukprot:scaffold32581_cov124-Isochrysis_galbana.AAC.5
MQHGQMVAQKKYLKTSEGASATHSAISASALIWAAPSARGSARRACRAGGGRAGCAHVAHPQALSADAARMHLQQTLHAREAAANALVCKGGRGDHRNRDDDDPEMREKAFER